MTLPEKAVVLASGGMDSCVTTAIAADNGLDIFMLHVNYGQRTERRELQAFEDLCRHYHIPDTHRLIVPLEHLRRLGGSSLTDPAMPVSRADLESQGIPTSYVPFRNAHILSIAVSWAEILEATRIFIGAVEEDSSGYPDCRQEFYDAFNVAVRLGTRPNSRIRVETPIIHLSKADIIRRGVQLRAPFHLTWSCYQREDVACGICDSCALRLRGFERAGVQDPIPYLERPTYP